MPYNPAPVQLAAELPPVASATIDAALTRAEAGKDTRGQWERLLIVQLDRRCRITFTVLAAGIRAVEYQTRPVTEARRVVYRDFTTASVMLIHGSPQWRRAVELLESSPELRPMVNTRGD